MKIFNFLAPFAIIFFALNYLIKAQEKTPSPVPSPAAVQKAKTPTPLPADLVSFFTGEWEGAGKFAGDKDIKASDKFSSKLDNQWLLYSHQDQLPNKYKALGMWGIERDSDKFLMIVADNFGGARRFESEVGWATEKSLLPSTIAARLFLSNDSHSSVKQTKLSK